MNPGWSLDTIDFVICLGMSLSIVFIAHRGSRGLKGLASTPFWSMYIGIVLPVGCFLLVSLLRPLFGAYTARPIWNELLWGPFFGGALLSLLLQFPTSPVRRLLAGIGFGTLFLIVVGTLMLQSGKVYWGVSQSAIFVLAAALTGGGLRRLFDTSVLYFGILLPVGTLMILILRNSHPDPMGDYYLWSYFIHGPVFIGFWLALFLRKPTRTLERFLTGVLISSGFVAFPAIMLFLAFGRV